MKIGTENKAELVLAIVLGIGALLAVARWAMPASESAPPPNSTVAAPARASGKAPAKLLTDSLDPQLRLDLLKTSEDVRYEGKGRNIFVAGAPPEIPTPKVPPLKDRQGQSTAQQAPPPPPPIDLKFFGFASRPGEPVKVFLSHGENIFVAREGDIVDRQYKVIKIGTNNVEIEDVLHNNRQSIPLIRG